MTQYTLEDLQALRESVDIEFKKAAGQSGRGELPKEFWPTYSAMANTEGGDIYLGIEEIKPEGGLRPVDLADIDRLTQNIFNLANNQQKISVNLLRGTDVEVLRIDGCNVLRVHVPRASRQQRPVYVGENPLKGSYIRRHEGDFHLDEASIKRMLAEQTDESRDSKILSRYTIDDLDMHTVDAYRQVFASRTPTHPFVMQGLHDFLRSIAAWRRDRDTGEEGLTLAGLLMFGRLNSIFEAVPNYIVDYQERPEAKAELRWIDRITTDGSWSGNLFDFYTRVFNKLTASLKVPYRNEGGVRQQITPVHEALQEALVNTLIHGDYFGRASIFVVKRPDMFGFRNPGLMRVPFEQAKRGGVSDCRNRLIQKMFQFVGAGDQAGSGVPRIYGVWKTQSWREPVVYERREPDQTLFELRMASLLPGTEVVMLEEKYGDRFRKLTHDDKVIVVSAAVERTIDHRRACELTSQHPADVTKQLGRLSRDGFLSPDGRGRGTYYWSAETSVSERAAFEGFEDIIVQSDKNLLSSEEALRQSLSDNAKHPPNSIDLDLSSIGLPANSIGLPVSSIGLERLHTIVKAYFPEGVPGKLQPEDMQRLILAVVESEYVLLKDLASVLGRSPVFLRTNYLKPMISRKMVELRFKENVNHPQQAYKKNIENPDESLSPDAGNRQS